MPIERTALDPVPQARPAAAGRGGQQTMVAAGLRQAFLQPDQDSARQVRRGMADQFRARWPKLGRLLDAEVPVAEIADQLSRHRSTIFREISRNLFRDVKEYRGYFPITANDSAKRCRQRRRKLVQDARLRHHVTEMLPLWWSPEQIAGTEARR